MLTHDLHFPHAARPQVDSELNKLLNGERLAAVFCVAGGWAGGNAASAELMKNTDLMIKQSVWTSVISAHISSKHLAEGGLLVLTGSQPCLKGMRASSPGGLPASRSELRWVASRVCTCEKQAHRGLRT